MKIGRLAAPLVAIATVASACSSRTFEINPMSESARASVSSVSIELSGSKLVDASGVGARGTDEGARRSTSQIPRMYGGGLVGLGVHMLVKGMAAATGAAAAQPELVVDETRGNLQSAMQDADFAELMRARLTSSKAAGAVQVAAVVVSPATVPLLDASGTPVNQLITLDYRLLLHNADQVNPSVGLVARVTARVLSPDRKRLFYRATWTYCGEQHNFVQMGTSNGAILRQQTDGAAFVLAEAVLYDLYVNKKPRKETNGCMDFSDLPSAGSQPKA